MLQTLKLLLPALVPSWRFFDVIAASPRIEYALLATAQDTPGEWRQFRPRPARLSVGGILKRLFWNPEWNESLFLVSCAERLMTDATEHSSREIAKRIQAELTRNRTYAGATLHWQFRLAFLSRQSAAVVKNILFVSPVYRSFEVADS